MLQITWHDGSMKYLHVDVHQLEEYQAKVEGYIVRLRERLNWLVSGSRAPFGVITEKRLGNKILFWQHFVIAIIVCGWW